MKLTEKELRRLVKEELQEARSRTSRERAAESLHMTSYRISEYERALKSSLDICINTLDLLKEIEDRENVDLFDVDMKIRKIISEINMVGIRIGG